MEELDPSSLYMSAIALLVLIIAVLLYMLLKKENEVKQAQQDTEAKRQAADVTTKTMEKVLDELKVMRHDLESKLETANASDTILGGIKALDQDMKTRFEELGTRVNVLNEIDKLRQEIELRFNIKFDKEAFTEGDLFSFLFTVSNALYRFDNYTRSREGDENLRTEARGYIAILRLAMAWARANGNEMVRKRVIEILPRAEATFNRMNEL